MRHLLDRSDEGGFTLVELLVTMTILGVVLAAVATGIMQVQRTAAGTERRLVDLGQARQGVDSAARTMRTATRYGNAGPFTELADTSVTFYALRNVANTGTPVRIQLLVDGSNQLLERQTPAAGGTTRERVLATGVQVAPGGRVFTYYPQYNAYVTATPSPTPGATPAAITTLSQQAAVRTVVITLSVQSGRYGARQTTVQTQVELPNVS